MAGFRSLDAFTKTRPDVQQKSAVGGLITVFAASAAGLLFFAQIISYIRGNTEHSLNLAESFSIPLLPLSVANDVTTMLSNAGKIPLRIHVTFPHLTCDMLDVSLDGASLASGELEKIHGRQALGLIPTTRSELSRLGVVSRSKTGSGCTVQGRLRPHTVAGVLAISVTQKAWLETTRRLSMQTAGRPDAMKEQLSHLNVSHYIHNIQFGKTPPRSTDKPLTDRAHWIDNSYGGIAVEHVQVKLVPTIYGGMLYDDQSYQMSVTDHTINPETLINKGVSHLPGLVVSYDFTPLAIRLSEGRDNFFVFLSSLVSIVGGAFVTVGLLTGCLVHSAKELAKKID